MSNTAVAGIQTSQIGKLVIPLLKCYIEITWTFSNIFTYFQTFHLITLPFSPFACTVYIQEVNHCKHNFVDRCVDVKYSQFPFDYSCKYMHRSGNLTLDSLNESQHEKFKISFHRHLN